MGKSKGSRQLCEALIRADTEKDVISLLSDAGYWDRPELWRSYGDIENNWGQSANQQSFAEAALAEKIVNAVDARLINECRVRGIDPKSKSAPSSIRSAIAQFFENGSGDQMAIGGRVDEWTGQEIRKTAQDITLCATGVRPAGLNITIADRGEGQTPDSLPDTILSLSKSNKMYIPFVQGQFNQGGTGALRFCGEENLQLVISRRNPELLLRRGKRDGHWGFTIVRRERPRDGRRNSVYTYLAPVGVGAGYEKHRGGVLSFVAEDFGIFPGNDGPYDQPARYGTAIKLYEYKYRGEKSNILRGKSLLSRLDLLLPEIALPVRIYEYRRNQNDDFLKPGSRETTLLGLLRRLKDSDNVEEIFPISLPFSPEGQRLVARVYAFKPRGAARDEEGDGDKGNSRKRLGGARGYRKNEGVVFTRNGQTQGSLPKDFFRRDSVKMKPLADDLLVFVDCDELSDDVREDLFMPSRDRLADNEFKSALIDALGKALRDCEQLKTLRNRRQRERIDERLKDDRPLTKVLQSLIKSSPNLTTLLELGQRISAPFNTMSTGSEESTHFKGEFYPSFFKIKGEEYGTLHKRTCQINQRLRFTFETDARNDYFIRSIERGSFALAWDNGMNVSTNASYVGPNLKNGIATVTLDLPDEIKVGDEITFVTTTKDSSGVFENRFLVTVKPERRISPVGDKRKRRPPTDRPGRERERPRQLAPPQIKRIYRDEWENHDFDESTAMKVELLGYEGENESTEIYQFKVNMDNMPLLNEIKQKGLEDSSARNQFLYANVLVGLSLLLDKSSGESQIQNGNEESGATPVEETIDKICHALAPFLLALTSLGRSNLGEDEGIEGLEEVG